MIRCDSCGFSNEDDATFCASCHAYLAWNEAPAEPTTEPRQAPTPAPSRERTDHEPSMVVAVATQVEQAAAIARAQDRPDLADQLKVAAVRMAERVVAVAVVGEFKRGKSTLVNALLRTEVCPVDADEVTAVPTLVRFGPRAGATAYVEAAGLDGDPTAQPLALDALGDYVLESGNPQNRRRLRSVEVRLPHRLLRSGLCLVDTPGVGGLNSAHGAITLRALDMAQGLLFVTDASQELTAPEVDFLRSALERCPAAACVVTKTDLYPQWRRIVELDREHLLRAGLDMPVIAVSSFLRMRSRVDQELEAESGFGALGDVLADVVNTGGERAAAVAAEQVTFVTDQIARTVEVERSVVEQPERAERVVADLTERHAQAQRLSSDAATWQQMLSDGVQDLVADVEHDLQQRLRTLVRDVESIIDSGDPKESWADIEVWLQRQIVDALVANQDLLSGRADELTRDVADRFNLECDQHVMLPGPSHDQLFADVRLPGVDSLSPAGGRLTQLLIAGRMATLVPMLIFGVAGQLLGGLTVVLAPVSAVLAVGVGRKILKDDKARQVSYRRQQAKAAVRRYVDEVAFAINKQARDSLRQTQRVLRDEFTGRARSIQRSSEIALDVVNRAAVLEPAARQQRADELVAQDAQLRALTQDAARLVAAGAGSGRG